MLADLRRRTGPSVANREDHPLGIAAGGHEDLGARGAACRALRIRLSRALRI
jgi:hypothetical protein